MALNAKSNPISSPKRMNGMPFAPGYSGNPRRSLVGYAYRHHSTGISCSRSLPTSGSMARPAIEKVRKQQPAAYMKICALLVPREIRVEHTSGVKA